ncbi:MAG TPA: hypothetical protein VKY26_12660, partial [Actinomycetota bacterium]|nr:hypothetical protein [Actinomycetota bacterium]
ILRAAGRRVADGDVEGLAELVALRGELDPAIGDAVAGLRNTQWCARSDIVRYPAPPSRLPSSATGRADEGDSHPRIRNGPA